MIKKVIILLIVVMFTINLFVGCSSREKDAVYIYKLTDGNQEESVVTLTWDNIDELKIITELGNEVVSSNITSVDTEMEYKLELVNANTDNDVFEIGFVDGMVCCTGEIQGSIFDHTVSTSITEKDIKRIIEEK